MKCFNPFSRDDNSLKLLLIVKFFLTTIFTSKMLNKP